MSRGDRDRRRAQGDLLSDLELAVSLARDAGALLLERFGHAARDVGVKSSSTDMVSAADRDAEALIQAGLRAACPDDGLLAEEGARELAASGRRWIVDPLDGTTNFLYGFPQWCVSIALEGSLGVIFDPVRDELFAAVRGSGATLNGEPIRMAAPPPLSTALIATGFGYDAERRGNQGQVLRRVVPHIRDIRRAGAAALDLAWVAAGRLDGYYERGLQAWDWAAARIIVEEAGGAVADLEPEPHGLAAAHRDLLPELLDLLREAEAGIF
ncbi:MAG TPA: inositol monophosphatase family protein [Thermoleophilaceae bacterium]|nr:inositol monophosphatase family protein [Thermoleophilaceae bacterium]